VNAIHPFPGAVAVIRGFVVAALPLAAVAAFVPGDYRVCAAVVVSFLTVLFTAGE